MIHFEDAYENYCALTGETSDKITLKPKVYTFEQLYNMALELKGDTFSSDYAHFQEEMNKLLNTNSITLPEATTRLIELVQEVIDLEGPAIIIAISGPYYPHVNNKIIKHKSPFSLDSFINEIAISIC